jgi:antitoxin MazE
MKLQLIPIGNSLGIRIPKTLLQQCHFKSHVNVTVIDNTLVLSSDTNPREGWEEAFKKMAQAGDDTLLDTSHNLSTFDKDEWEW